MSYAKHMLFVHVNDQFTADAGWWEEAKKAGGAAYRLVHPPERTMFEQLLDYLEEQAALIEHAYLKTAEQALAATLVCLRWGTYFAVLTDHTKPLWLGAKDPSISRIGDSEMARTNIEVSAAMEQWIDIMRSDEDQYLRLATVALRLPSAPAVYGSRRTTMLEALATPVMAEVVISEYSPEQIAEAREVVEKNPSRVLANSLANFCWRNGPIEDIHAEKGGPRSLLYQPLTVAEDKRIVRWVAHQMNGAMWALFGLTTEPNERTWPERVLPYRLVPPIYCVAANHWSLTERTREVRLAGTEPACEARATT